MPASLASDDFLWRVEEACANAYPASREMLLDGWLLRAAGGKTRRINSVNPLRSGPVDPTDVIESAAAVYGRLDQPLLFRVPSLVPAMEAALARRGFSAEGGTLTLMAGTLPAETPADIVSVVRAEPAWLAAWATCRPDADAETVAAYGKAVGSLLLPAAFVRREVEGTPVAVAYAALHRGVAILESVVTHPAHRGRGHARAVVTATMAWARQAGAEAFCLQVAADNAPARALYASLGFDRELYRYHYRTAPPGL